MRSITDIPGIAFVTRDGDRHVRFALVALVVVGLAGLPLGRPLVTLVALTTLGLTLFPFYTWDDRLATISWGIILLSIGPIAAGAFFGDRITHQFLLYASAGFCGLIAALNLHTFTPLRLGRRSTMIFTTLSAATVAAAWATVTWLFDVIFTTSTIAHNTEAMVLLIIGTLSGIIVGTAADRYYGDIPGEEVVDATVDGLSETAFARLIDAADYPPLEAWLPIEASTQRWIIRTMRVGILLMAIWGVTIGDVAIVINAGAMLFVTYLPAALRERFDLPFDRGLVLWVTLVVFLHTLGSVYIYDVSFWYHNITHPASATIVGAIAYIAVRVVDARRPTVHVPPVYLPWLVIGIVVAFGVFWEIGEFIFDILSALFDVQMPLAQYGLDDTMSDLIFNAIGGVIFVKWGIPFVTDLTDAIIDRFGGPIENGDLQSQVPS